MSYEMKNLRKEDLSLYFHLKHKVLMDFIEREENIPLEFISVTSCYEVGYVYAALTTMIPSPVDRGRGWVYFDTCSGTTTICNLDASGNELVGYPVVSGIKEQSTRVVVYDANGLIVDENEYMVDYIDGRIVTSGIGEIDGYGSEDQKPTRIDYYFNYISLVDEWAAIEAADPPVVVIDVMGTDKGGYQLGPGKRVVRKVDIHVFASDTAERNDIVETIYDGLYLKSTPLYDFTEGSVLEYDGTWFGRKGNMNKLETLFDTSYVSGYLGNNCTLQFENVTTRHISLPLIMTQSRDEVMLSDLNAYRSKISFDMVSYTKV
jgi:hypothetical protein